MFHIPFNNRYVALGEKFYQRVQPERVISPALIRFNEGLANELGIASNGVTSSELADCFSGNVLPGGAVPLAMVYSGHQFGQFNPYLGDGRALLLGEVESEQGAFEIHLKGSGRTAFSRNGDGKAALGPVLREYILSEAMHALGIPTTRALAAVTTGEEVARESLLPGGVITRVASSFVRVGTFQYFMAQDDFESLKKLADHMIARHYPESTQSENCYEGFLEAVVERQAILIAQWMQLGFIHGVMNTDNMSIAGETIDYGPCAFMDTYAHEQVYSSIDHQGRYAYNNQPQIGLWNLTRFAETLLPLLADDPDHAVEVAQQALKKFVATYEEQWLIGMRKKVGLTTKVDESIASNDTALIKDLFNCMAKNHADFTLAFYHLSQLTKQGSEDDDAWTSLFDNTEEAGEWLSAWRQRLSHEACSDAERQTMMQAVNPVYIPRNHQVEAAIRAAEDHNDFSVFHALHEVLQHPFTYQAGCDSYMQPPRSDEVVHQTFCGT